MEINDILHKSLSMRWDCYT